MRPHLLDRRKAWSHRRVIVVGFVIALVTAIGAAIAWMSWWGSLISVQMLATCVSVLLFLLPCLFMIAVYRYSVAMETLPPLAVAYATAQALVACVCVLFEAMTAPFTIVETLKMLLLAICGSIAAWCLLILFVWGSCRLVFGQVTYADPTQCVQCGYDLTGNESGVCPECGVGA